MSKIVIALGGNALGSTPAEQSILIKQTAKPIVDLIESGHELVIVHGNGPQVGLIKQALSSAAGRGEIAGDIPFPECGAMSQGYIGYQLQKAVRNELNVRKIKKEVVTLITEVIVDENDPAFENPSKPIGAFYSEEEARQIMAEKGYVMVEDAGRGWRRIVSSPRPIDMVEKASITALADAGHVVIAAGGGGVPVLVRSTGRLKAVSAVIDKDFAAAKLAELVKADTLLILTAVEQVALDWGKECQRFIRRMTVAEAQKHCDDKQFAPGSMLPKVQAAMAFAESGGRAIIAALSQAKDALDGRSGTVIEQ